MLSHLRVMPLKKPEYNFCSRQKDCNRCFFSVQKLSSFLGQSSNNNNESTKFQVKRVKTCWTRENGSAWKINDLSSLLKRPIYAFFLLFNRKWKKLMPMLDGSVRWPGPKLWLVLNTTRPKTEGSFKLNETSKMLSENKLDSRAIRNQCLGNLSTRLWIPELLL